MSGHSKWSSIKHKKGIKDARRSSLFTKLANAITITARAGGGDPEMNFRLRLAMQKAKEANLPNDRIEKSIARGTGEGGGAKIEELTMEGYGPAGIAIIIKAISDNRNRTVSDLRNIMTKNGGRLSGSGSVDWVFESKGVIIIDMKSEIRNLKSEDIEMAAIDAGAADIDDTADSLTIYTAPDQVMKVKKELEDQDIKIESAEISLEPKNTVEISDATIANKILKLMEVLEDYEDVVSVSANFDISEELMEEISGK